jgi:hypothetical protein
MVPKAEELQIFGDNNSTLAIDHKEIIKKYMYFYLQRYLLENDLDYCKRRIEHVLFDCFSVDCS